MQIEEIQLLSLNISNNIDGYETDCKSCNYFLIKEYLSKSEIKSYTILSSFIDMDNDSYRVK